MPVWKLFGAWFALLIAGAAYWTPAYLLRQEAQELTVTSVAEAKQFQTQYGAYLGRLREEMAKVPPRSEADLKGVTSPSEFLARRRAGPEPEPPTWITERYGADLRATDKEKAAAKVVQNVVVDADKATIRLKEWIYYGWAGGVGFAAAGVGLLIGSIAARKTAGRQTQTMEQGPG